MISTENVNGSNHLQTPHDPAPLTHFFIHSNKLLNKVIKGTTCEPGSRAAEKSKKDIA